MLSTEDPPCFPMSMCLCVGLRVCVRVCATSSPRHPHIASLRYNNLNDNAKQLLKDANRKRSTPAVLEF